MTRQMRFLATETIDDLPLPCRACVFWEDATASRGSAPGGRETKEAWVGATSGAWGPPGRVIYLDGQPIAFAVLVPEHYAGRVGRLNHAPSADALLLATMWVHQRARGAGLGRILLQALMRDTHQRGGRAVEAYGARGAAGFGRCVLSESFLLASGFSVLHEDARMPLLRLDLRQTVRWQESVAGALQEVVGVLSRRRPDPVPVRPAGPGLGLLWARQGRVAPW